MLRSARAQSVRRPFLRGLVALGLLLSSCSFLLDFPAEGDGDGGGGGGGGGGAGVCEPLWVEACGATASETATSCAEATRMCDAEGAAFGPCQCGGLAWGESFGSPNGTARGTSVAVDWTGDVVVAGTFTGSINLGGSTLTSAGAADIFLAKFSSTGEHLWSQAFGAVGDQTAPPLVAVDLDGGVVLAGGFIGTVAFGGAPLTAPSAFGNMFVARFDPAGVHFWSRTYGDEGVIRSLAVADNSDIVVAGTFQGFIDIGATTGNLGNLGDIDEVFALRLDPEGNGIWNLMQLTSDYSDTMVQVQLDPSGEVILAGVFQGDLTGNGGLALSSATPMLYVVRYAHDPVDGTSSPTYIATAIASGDLTLTGAAFDATGPYFTGAFKGTFEPNGVTPLSTVDSTEDLYVLKLDLEGNTVFAYEPWFEDGDTRPTSITSSPDGDVTVVGSMTDQVDFGGGFVAPATGATQAAFVVEFSPSGHVFSKALGGPEAIVTFSDSAFDGASGDLLVTGQLLGEIDLGQGPLSGTDDLLMARFRP